MTFCHPINSSFIRSVREWQSQVGEGHGTEGGERRQDVLRRAKLKPWWVDVVWVELVSTSRITGQPIPHTKKAKKM